MYVARKVNSAYQLQAVCTPRRSAFILFVNKYVITSRHIKISQIQPFRPNLSAFWQERVQVSLAVNLHRRFPRASVYSATRFSGSTRMWVYGVHIPKQSPVHRGEAVSNKGIKECSDDQQSVTLTTFVLYHTL